MRVVASEAFKINVRPSTNFQRMLAGGSGSLSSSTDQLQQVPPPLPPPLVFSGSTLLGGAAPQVPSASHAHAAATAAATAQQQHEGATAPAEASAPAIDNEGAPVAANARLIHAAHMHPASSSASAPAASSSAVDERGRASAADMRKELMSSPQTTPLSTPTLERRPDVFSGPTLSLFAPSGDSAMSGAVALPGREALPVASLMSYQSALFEEIKDQQALEGQSAEGGDAAGATEQKKEANTAAAPPSFGLLQRNIFWPRR